MRHLSTHPPGGVQGLLFALAVVYAATLPPACDGPPDAKPDAAAAADAGDDARDFPEPETCEAVCDHVYNTCGMEFPEDDRMPYNRQACYNDCLYGWFDGAEGCLREAECNRRSVISCVRDDDVNEAIDDPCDDGDPWPEAWVDYEKRVLALTNERRAEGAICGGEQMEPVPPLEMDPRLRCAARRHSRDMAERDYFAHESPDGEDPTDRAAAVDYPTRAVGENISGGNPTPEETVEGWMNSTGHCKNIMRPEYEDIGIGYVRDKGSGFDHLATQMFGRGN